MKSLLRRITLFALIVIVGTGAGTDIVRAQGNEYDPGYWSGNNNWYYDGTYQATCAEGGGALRGGSTKEKIWNFLIANKLSPEQAAGLMANMQQESGFIPVRYQGDRNFDPWTPNRTGEGKGWGLVQWDGGRRLDILDAIKDEKSQLVKYVEFEYNGIAEPNDKFPAKDFDEFLLFELDFMMQESKARNITAAGFPGSADKEWPRMQEQPTLRDATLFWERNFEVSGDNQAQKEARVVNAQSIFDEFGDNTSAAGSGTSGCAAAGNIQELALAYAWPEYHPPNYPQKKPAYEEAIRKTQSEGGFVGGGQYPGVDCGGFVTNLVINSGYDPNYNDRKGDTSVQLQWLRDNWTRIGRGGDEGLSTKLESAGVAVAIYHNGANGHTFIYLGEEMVELGFGGEGSGAKPGIASASYQIWRAPMAGNESTLSPSYEWFVKG